MSGARVRAKRAYGKKAVDSQHGSGVKGISFASLHKGLLPKVKGLLIFMLITECADNLLYIF
jgi:hypothetical protein